MTPDAGPIFGSNVAISTSLHLDDRLSLNQIVRPFFMSDKSCSRFERDDTLPLVQSDRTRSFAWPRHGIICGASSPRSPCWS
jgi:hypothetical protein